MAANVTQLRRLDDIQRRASRIIGSNLPLDSLSHRRVISGLGLLHRMHKPESPELIRNMLPPRLRPERATRSNCMEHMLQPMAGRTVTGHWSLQQYDRSVLPAIVPVWNGLPADVIGTPATEDTKAFCKRAHRYILERNASR
jgi:hypothetical protein